MATGLVLGKFAPLHKGHQLLIETALEENEDVIVMIYDAPDVTSIPLPVRSQWIRTLYPAARVIEAWDGPAEVGDTPAVKRRHEAYILRMLDGRPIANFYSSEFYGRHVSDALGARDRRVDSDRERVPVSASAIRENAYALRAFVDPLVYRDMITKVVFLGAPSTGKTTLARELADAYGTLWMPEYGREFWDAHQQDRRLSLDQLVQIAEGHRTREDALVLDANRFLFVDTDATTTFMFSMYYHGRVPSRLAELASETRQRYDLFFLCGDEMPYDDTWDRSGEANRTVFQAQTRADLIQRGVPFISLSGGVRERMQRVSALLDRFDKYRSLGDNLRVDNLGHTI